MIVFGTRELLVSYVLVLILVLVHEDLINHLSLVWIVLRTHVAVSLSMFQLFLQEISHFLPRQPVVAIGIDFLENVCWFWSILDLDDLNFKS